MRTAEAGGWLGELRRTDQALVKGSSESMEEVTRVSHFGGSSGKESERNKEVVEGREVEPSVQKVISPTSSQTRETTPSWGHDLWHRAPPRLEKQIVAHRSTRQARDSREWHNSERVLTARQQTEGICQFALIMRQRLSMRETWAAPPPPQKNLLFSLQNFHFLTAHCSFSNRDRRRGKKSCSTCKTLKSFDPKIHTHYTF